MLVYAPRGAEGYFVVCLLVKLATHAITLSNPSLLQQYWWLLGSFYICVRSRLQLSQSIFPIFVMHFKCILVHILDAQWMHSGCTAPSTVHLMRERDAAAGRRVMQDKDRKRRRDPLISWSAALTIDNVSKVRDEEGQRDKRRDGCCSLVFSTWALDLH